MGDMTSSAENFMKYDYFLSFKALFALIRKPTLPHDSHRQVPSLNAKGQPRLPESCNGS